MSPTQRLQLVQRVTDDKERRQAQRLAQSRARVAQCEAKLKELQGYHAGYVRDFDKRAAAGIARVIALQFLELRFALGDAGYVRDFDKRAAAGIGGAGIREFHAFLAKLAEAIRQQEELLDKARADSESERNSWQGAAQRSQIIDKVVERHAAKELKDRDQRDQRESDDRGQRNATGRLDSGGN